MAYNPKSFCLGIKDDQIFTINDVKFVTEIKELTNEIEKTETLKTLNYLHNLKWSYDGDYDFMICKINSITSLTTAIPFAWENNNFDNLRELSIPDINYYSIVCCNDRKYKNNILLTINDVFTNFAYLDSFLIWIQQSKLEKLTLRDPVSYLIQYSLGEHLRYLNLSNLIKSILLNKNITDLTIVVSTDYDTTIYSYANITTNILSDEYKSLKILEFLDDKLQDYDILEYNSVRILSKNDADFKIFQLNPNLRIRVPDERNLNIIY